MIAEIYGKISSTGTNLTERLEDNLTGNFFGALRYLPFSMGVSKVLVETRIPELSQILCKKQLNYWANAISFWPYHDEGELDILIELDDVVVGIEVKYLSGLSSDDEVDNMKAKAKNIKSVNQLAKESRIVKKIAGKKKGFLVLIADANVCAGIYKDVIARNILAEGVGLGYISWQEILMLFKDQIIENEFHRLVFSDIIALLKRKGFQRFQSFHLADQITIRNDDYFLYQMQKCRSNFNFALINQIRKDEYYEYS